MNFANRFLLLCGDMQSLYAYEALQFLIHSCIQSVPWQADIVVDEDFYVTTF